MIRYDDWIKKANEGIYFDKPATLLILDMIIYPTLFNVNIKFGLNKYIKLIKMKITKSRNHIFLV